MSLEYEGTPLDRDLISSYRKLEDISYKESERRIALLLDLIRKKLIENHCVELRRLGVLYIRTMSRMRYRNFQTKQMEELKNFSRVFFRPAVSIKRELNAHLKIKIMKKIKS